MINEEYKKNLQTLHSNKKFIEPLFLYEEIKQFINLNNPKSIIDYGCAQGRLVSQLQTDFSEMEVIDGYDPGVPQYENKPVRKYDLLISTDVFEHIEPIFLKETLEYIDNLYLKFAWINIACYPAKKVLADGRNAHLIVESPNWWIEKISTIMSNSDIIFSDVIVKNPDKGIKSKFIRINKGDAKELRIVLKKK